MHQTLTFHQATPLDRPAVEALWLSVLTHAFKQQGHALDFRPEDELAFKMRQYDAAMASPHAHYFLAYELGQLIGTIAYETPPNPGILRRTEGRLKDLYEIGSLYIDPSRQKQGLSTVLLKFVLTQLIEQGIETVCFDSILEHSQTLWVKRFGPPTYITHSDDESFRVFIWVIRTQVALERLNQKTANA